VVITSTAPASSTSTSPNAPPPRQLAFRHQATSRTIA
jgi:hypothetical protein